MAEPQKLAEFLRSRCDSGLYGLRYLDNDKKFLFIPWTVAPKLNEERSPEFQMFQEWAQLSFMKRGGKSEAELHEAPTNQKHRFRNALTKANGIQSRGDIKIEGGKVYQFVEKHRRRRNSSDADSGGSSGSADHSPTFALRNHNDYETLQCRRIDELPPNYDDFGGNVQLSPFCDRYDVTNIAFPPNPGFGSPPVCYRNQSDLDAAMMTSYGNRDLLPTPLEVPRATATIPPPSSYQSPEHETLPHFYHHPSDALPDPNQYAPDPRHRQYAPPPPIQAQPQTQQRLLTSMARNLPPIIGADVPAQDVGNRATAAAHLVLRTRYREADATCHDVTSPYGCRVYSGSNIRNFTCYLERERLDAILRKYRHDQDQLFGPDALQQLKLPVPDALMKSQQQLDKTKSILDNMDRGLMLLIDWTRANQFRGIPDVQAVRLCQTRIFPFRAGGSDNERNVPPTTLQRMQPFTMFSAEKFCRQLDGCTGVRSQFPSYQFALALGQRVTDSECNNNILVSITVTVQPAFAVIQSLLSVDDELCISKETSMDEEARQLALDIQNTVRLNSKDDIIA